eukprot:10332393-Alexandrium_andersonii.AAC.1
MNRAPIPPTRGVGLTDHVSDLPGPPLGNIWKLLELPKLGIRIEGHRARSTGCLLGDRCVLRLTCTRDRAESSEPGKHCARFDRIHQTSGA